MVKVQIRLYRYVSLLSRAEKNENSNTQNDQVEDRNEQEARRKMTYSRHFCSYHQLS